MTGIISKALRKPSIRTQLEATMTGMITMLLVSLSSCVYIVGYTDASFFLKLFSILGEIGIFFFIGSGLVSTYQQYYFHKLQMGLYKCKAVKENE